RVASARQELPPNPLPPIPERKPATELATEWKGREKLEVADVLVMLKRLTLTQTDVAMAVGRSDTWLNSILRGGKVLGPSANKLLREFVDARAAAERGAP